jgi:hypothetical protein
MKQWIKYVLVGLIFFVIGGLLVFFVDRHTKLIEKATPMSALDQLKKDGKEKASGHKNTDHSNKKVDNTKDTSKKKGNAGNTKEAQKNEKKETDKKNGADQTKSDESVEYLRSLWPVKKRKAAVVSGKKTGPLYLSGTSPYGPPQDYKDQIMQPTESLKVQGAPQPTKPLPPLKNMVDKSVTETSKPSKPLGRLYQIEVGKFSSLDKALAAKKMLMNEGFPVRIYYQGHITSPDWFFVRLNKTFYEHQAHQQAQQMARLLRITPSVVAFNEALPHLK